MFVGYDEHRRAYRILPDGAIKYVLARVVVFDERPIIRKMLSSCTKSGNIGDHDDCSSSSDDTPAPRRQSKPIDMSQRQLELDSAQPKSPARYAGAHADVASPKDIKSPCQLLISSKGTQLLHDTSTPEQIKAERKTMTTEKNKYSPRVTRSQTSLRKGQLFSDGDTALCVQCTEHICLRMMR